MVETRNSKIDNRKTKIENRKTKSEKRVCPVARGGGADTRVRPATDNGHNQQTQKFTRSAAQVQSERGGHLRFCALRLK
jgi:hypothetical protein